MQSLVEAIAKAATISAEDVSKALVRPKDIGHGDYSFPAFLLAKSWKISPPEAAKKLQETIVLPTEIEKAEIVGPYLNFFLNRKKAGGELIKKILKLGSDVGRAKVEKETIVLEYSAPNIAKHFGVHHLRTTLIGASLHRIYKFLGYKTIAVNHLGDWGTQFGFVYAGWKEYGQPASPTLDDLQDLYIRASKLKKAQEEGTVPAEDAAKPDIQTMARDFFIRLEAGDAEATKFWKWCVDISQAYFDKTYDRLGIKFDYTQGEAFYSPMLPRVEETIRASGVLQDSRGARGVDLGKKLGFVRIFTEDGRSLYITRDIACAFYREETYKPAQIIYVVAAQQSLHFQQLVGVLRELKHPVAEKIKHVSFGFVPGMKTREGGAIPLDDFLSEAHDRARDAYRTAVQKRPEGTNEEEIAEKVAIAAVYFYFLSHVNNKDFHFSWDEALSFTGDSGPYIQYALARLHSLETKAKEAGVSLADDSFNADLIGDEAYELVSLLGKFDEVLEKTRQENEPCLLAAYTLSIAKAFSAIYRNFRVVGEETELAKARLALFIATRHVLNNALTLLGMPAVERM